MAMPRKDVVQAEAASLTTLIDAANIAQRALEKRLSRLKLSVTQQRILSDVYYARESLTPSMLGGLLFQEAHSVSGMLNRLEDRDLITRTHDKQDRRVIWIGLTPKGRTVAEEAIQVLLTLAREFKGILDARTNQVLLTALGQIREQGSRIAGVHDDLRQEALRRVSA
jgi:DNA-binding MarR family transcriptional regulator